MDGHVLFLVPSRRHQHLDGRNQPDGISHFAPLDMACCIGVQRLTDFWEA